MSESVDSGNCRGGASGLRDLGRSQVLQTLTLVRSLGVQRLRLLFGLVVKPRRGVGEVCGWEGKSKGRNRERKGL